MAYQSRARTSESETPAQKLTRGDTIAAVATALGRAGIGIVRLSGPLVRKIASEVTGQLLEDRKATFSRFRAASGESIDEGIALYFAAPRSYTGEDVLELQAHGGPVVLNLLLERCVSLGARLAEPGEYTRRAFLNGKLDLAQAESVIDLIDASTRAAARCAIRSLEGEFSQRIQALNVQLLELRAFIEATLDFPEEEIDGLDRAQVSTRIEATRAALGVVLDAAHQGSVMREGLHIAIVGAPNVGKSSLLNSLAGREVAIVTDIPGTTRDPIREVIELEGIPLHIIDTAGLHESTDPVEKIGIARAWSAIDKADAIILVTEAASDAVTENAALTQLRPALPRIRVRNKIDLLGIEPAVSQAENEVLISLSAKTGAGMGLLRNELLKLVGWHSGTEPTFLARQRHLLALREAQAHLDSAAEQTGAAEFAAEELRHAQSALSRITGEVTVDDLLGEIFSRFCIGK